jgi:threonylcarbamoyladenosine tRNA methylthiotransferase CDKAL1
VRVLVRGFGCSSSVADAEAMAGCLREAGFELTQRVADADVVVYNTCGVKAPTENRMLHLLRTVPSGKRLVVAGCLPLINYPRITASVRFDAVVGPAFGDGIVGVVRRVLNGEKVVALDGSLRAKPSLGLPRARVSPVVGIVPVAYGCVGECSYCCVRFARGGLRSFGVEEIVNYVKKSVGEGVREFWLTGQDVACYGMDVGVNLVDLLESVCDVDEEFWVRVGMMTPNTLMPLLESYSRFLSSQKGKARVFEFLHVPVQSGDEGVLRLMNRRYTVEDFKHIITTIRHASPKVTVATDVIVGFPGESKKAFQKTCELIEEVRPDVVNVSKFFARPNTAAEKLADKVDAAEIKRRTEIIAALVRRIALEKNRTWIGWSGSVLIDEKGKKPGSWVGRNFAYKPVVVHAEGNLLGKLLDIRVVDGFQSHLLGEVF